MLNAVEALRLDRRLLDEVGAALGLEFPSHHFFQAPAGPLERLLAFPPLTGAEIDHLEAWVARLLEHPSWRPRFPAYREINDRHGRRRELVLAQPAADYQGREAWVGPFASEEDANTWARSNLRSPYVHDVLPQAGSWFCDVFSGEGEAPDGVQN